VVPDRTAYKLIDANSRHSLPGAHCGHPGLAEALRPL